MQNYQQKQLSHTMLTSWMHGCLLIDFMSSTTTWSMAAPHPLYTLVCSVACYSLTTICLLVLALVVLLLCWCVCKYWVSNCFVLSWRVFNYLLSRRASTFKHRVIQLDAAKLQLGSLCSVFADSEATQ